MKNIFLKAVSFLAIGYGMTSCLDGDPTNFPPDQQVTFAEMGYVIDGGNNINSGLFNFGGQTLLLNPADDTVTLVYSVTIQGPFTEDVNVTVNVDDAAIADNLPYDKIKYALMSSSQYRLLGTTGVVHPGKTPYAEFKIELYPKNIDFTKSWILPMTSTNDAGILMATNYSHVYFHIIGNAIAGLYNWDFTRISSLNDTDPPDGNSFKKHTAVFLPIDPFSVNTKTGYYDGGPYLITFTDPGSGKAADCTDFRAVIDPAAAKTWADASININVDPVLTAENGNTKFTIKYKVVGPSGGRTCIDVFTKK